MLFAQFLNTFAKKWNESHFNYMFLFFNMADNGTT